MEDSLMQEIFAAEECTSLKLVSLRRGLCSYGLKQDQELRIFAVLLGVWVLFRHISCSLNELIPTCQRTALSDMLFFSVYDKITKPEMLKILTAVAET